MARRVERVETFQGEFRFLSNFYVLTTPLVCDLRVLYTSVEQAFQAHKSVARSDRVDIARLTPAKAKIAGRQLPLREDWEDIKYAVMLQFLLQKFLYNGDCREWLLGTGDAVLIEGNHWGDRTWGQVNGQGENHLGRLLMQVRDLLRGRA
jgi:ribA/ribD-fused uncharacterized protein